MTSNATCASQTPVVSSPTIVNVTNIDIPFIQGLFNILAASTDIGIQWYLNGNPIAGANSQFYEATQTGFYTVTTTLNGCSATSALYSHTMSVTGIEENTPKTNIFLFPNPANNQIIIAIKNNTLIGANLEIYNAHGQLVVQAKLTSNSQTINTSSLTSGMYNVQINNGKGVLNKRIIIQH